MWSSNRWCTSAIGDALSRSVMNFRDRWPFAIGGLSRPVMVFCKRWSFSIGALSGSVVFYGRWWSLANGGLFWLVVFHDRWRSFANGGLFRSVVFRDRWWCFANGGLFKSVFFFDRWSFAIGFLVQFVTGQLPDWWRTFAIAQSGCYLLPCKFLTFLPYSFNHLVCIYM